MSIPAYQVGRFYRVPAVRVNRWNTFVGWLPVLGPEHEDREIIGFPYQHFHIDWRFAPVAAWNWASSLRLGKSGVFSWIIHCPDSRGDKVIEEGPTLRRMKCKRELPPYPVEAAKWLPELSRRFACTRLINGKCPHRGIPVESMILDGDVLTCPAHGLRWSAITGEAIPQ